MKKLKIDMWYGDRKEEADKIDIFFNDLDCMYSGNIYDESGEIAMYNVSAK